MADHDTSGELNWNLEAFREANAHWRSIFEQFYKHAAMTFVLNGVLFTALSYTLPDQKVDFATSYALVGILISLMVSAVGIVFNLGAGIAFRRLWEAWRDIHRRGVTLQENLIASEFRYYDVIDLGGRPKVYILTNVFYGFLTVGWIAIFLLVVLQTLREWISAC
ncbi:MAG: hypothetical protein RLW87_09665 [Alphaproteobacteria bacterium]|nr:hypothetical protein [Pseudomonadota bacterium]